MTATSGGDLTAFPRRESEMEGVSKLNKKRQSPRQTKPIKFRTVDCLIARTLTRTGTNARARTASPTTLQFTNK